MFNKGAPSLSRKITLSFVLANISTLILAASLIVYFDYRYLKSNLIEEAQTMAKMLAYSTAPALLFNDQEAAENSLLLLSQNPNFTSAMVSTTQWEFYASYPPKAEDKTKNNKQKPGVYFSETMLSVVEKVTTDGEHVGYITVCLSLETLSKRVNQYLVLLVGVSSIALIFLCVILLLVRKNLAIPLGKLARFAKQITSDENYKSRLSLDSKDEVGSLVKAFNNMMDAIESRDQRLQENTNNLEKMVEIRSAQLHQRANYDFLTNLPNRHLLLDRLDRAIASGKRHNNEFAVLFLDLDRFKLVNDNFGHAKGDLLLKAVSKRLSGRLRAEDTVSRLGGDEFVILVNRIKCTEDVELVANNVIAELSTPFEIDNLRLHTSTSIGISIYPRDGDTSELLIKRADTSMYKSKQRGAGNFTFYNEKFESESLERLSIETEIRNGFNNNKYEVYYQPQHKSQDNNLVGFECLLRLHGNNGKMIPPDLFIPVAEEIGLINKIGLWVTNIACEKLESLQKEGLGHLTMSVNISAYHLMELDFTDQIEQICNAYEFDINRLELEITEATMLVTSELTLYNIRKLRNLGIRIAIDDFGTGYSSLSYLRDLPVSTLKVDGSFIEDLESDVSCQGIVSSTILLGQSLGLKTVAEKVETKMQLKFLKDHNCDLIQGYYFSPPMPEKELLSYISQSYSNK